MKVKWDKRGLCAFFAAAAILAAGAWYPQPQGAWWCTAFSVVCEQAAAPADKPDGNEGRIVFKWKLAEVWREIMG